MRPNPTQDSQEKTYLDTPPETYAQFQQNLAYARKLIHGGRNLEKLGVGAFDVTDLYRAAWTQSVAALDHWVTREIIDRALALVVQPAFARPPKFGNLSIPVERFERIHHHGDSIERVFREHLEQHFSFMTFQSPEKIKEGFSYVSTVNLWVSVAKALADQNLEAATTSDAVRAKLREIAWRRNNIAHTADHDPDRPGQKSTISDQEAEEAVNWIESIVIAIRSALGDPIPAASRPFSDAKKQADADRASDQRLPSQPRRQWDEEGVISAIGRYCSPEVAATLLAIYRHAESHPAFRGYSFGRSENPAVSARFDLGYDEAAVWTIYASPKKSVLSINFEYMRNRGVPLARLSRLAEDLTSLPGWTRMAHQLSSADYAKRPNVDLHALGRLATSEVVLTAVGELLHV
ncbi:hypothetical protein J5X84_43890 [Streptosporangiaceae bacterium NEAU-GS5]|nr:hypothetical protein [Streptosporangiaceae bacterium NEAU-GS5]